MAGLRGMGVHGIVSGSAYTTSTPGSVNQAAFGTDATRAVPSKADIFKPNDGFGIAFWLGVGAIGLLVLVRRSLPTGTSSK